MISFSNDLHSTPIERRTTDIQLNITPSAHLSVNQLKLLLISSDNCYWRMSRASVHLNHLTG